MKSKRVGQLLGIVILLIVVTAVEVCGQNGFYMPDNTKTVKYALKLDNRAGIEVEIGGHSYKVSSRFSTTAPHKWNYFGKSKNGWSTVIRRSGAKQYIITASDGSYRLERKINRLSDHIDIQDTFTNLTNTLVGIIFDNTITPSAEKSVLRVGGISAEDAEAIGFALDKDKNQAFSSLERPFVQAAAGNGSSLGMVAVDDVFRAQEETYRSAGTVGIRDLHFGLDAKKSYTVKWQLYPVEAGDHFSFINRVRRNWGSNYLIDGPFGYIHAMSDISDDEIKRLLDESGLKIGCYITESNRLGTEAFGTAYLEEAAGFRDIVRKSIARVNKIKPDLRTVLYYHCYADNVINAEQRYPDCRMMLTTGKQYVFDYPGGWGVKIPFFYPTLSNEFGKVQNKIIDEMLKETNNGGVYWDEMEFGVNPRYLKGIKEWDGHSVEIDPQSHRAVSKISQVTLLTQPFIDSMVKRLKKLGNVPYCNFLPATKTGHDWHLPRFIEYTSKWTAPCTHLASPLSLGLGDIDTPVIKLISDDLDLGLLYVYHRGVYAKYPSPIVAKMYPITPIELHEGYIIAKEKIITNKTGAYGWGEKKLNGEVFIYGTDGKLTDRRGTQISKDSKAFWQVELNPGEVAVIMR